MNENIEIAQPRLAESIALLALLISLTALAIDIMLPALPEIGRELGTKNGNDPQLVIAALILGLSLGQIVYGPLSDSFGRKPLLATGIVVFIGGCALSLFATGFSTMLTGRLLQGIGLAAPRTMVLAIIRDQYQGRTMARMMSSIMGVFILVPAIAPAIGQGILRFGGWRAIFASLLCLSGIALIWFLLRQPETHPHDMRSPFSPRGVGIAVVFVCRERLSFAYILISGCILGAFFGYLNSAQQIFQDIYRLADTFPLYFGSLALAIGTASFMNARLVMKFGMKRLTDLAILVLVACSVVVLPCFAMFDGRPPLGLLLLGLAVNLFCYGILFGNLSTIAMQPLGRIAGTGAAVVGALSTFIAVPMSVFIGRCYDGTVMPLFGGFAILGGFSFWLKRRADRRWEGG